MGVLKPSQDDARRQAKYDEAKRKHDEEVARHKREHEARVQAEKDRRQARAVAKAQRKATRINKRKR